MPSPGEEEVFLPLVLGEVVTILVVSRDDISQDMLSSVLEALGATPDEIPRHTELLLRRSARGPALATTFRTSRPKYARDITLYHLEGGLGLPVYQRRGNPLFARNLQWTLDIFNPLNLDCRVACYDLEKEYLALVVRASTFKPYNVVCESRSLEEIVPRYMELFGMVTTAYEKAGAEFAFGTAHNHLNWLCDSHHIATRKRKKPLGFEEVVWEWAVYPKEKQGRLSLDESALGRTRAWGSKPRGLWTIEVEGGGVLLYTIDSSSLDFAGYARTVGLKDVFSVNLKQL